MEHTALHDIIETRKRKLEALRGLGIDPFGARFDTDGTVGQVAAAYHDGGRARLAGRITAWRDMGRSQFLDLSDFTGRLQIYLNSKDFSPADWEAFKLLDLGDFLGVEGIYFTTKTGERSVRVERFTILTKSLRPLPEKWHGLHDPETKYRQRYLDLIANAPSRDIFAKRFRIISEIRNFLAARGFIEVETPMMQPIAGGAAATPFVTHHHALDMPLYLRIAPELYLKRLLVAGLPRVFELNRNFRNEGLSRRHNPEFTMLEAYQAFGDFETMANLVEELVCHVAKTLCGTLIIEHRSPEGELLRAIDLRRPWKRARYADLIEEAAPGWFSLSPEQRRAKAISLGLDLSGCTEDYEVTQHLFEKLIEEKTINPLFVTHCPKELVPLARLSPEGSTVEVYELVMNGQEISPGYSELNDPLLQRQRLLEQSGGQTQALDEDFLLALEHGMPPAGGLGIGIDRLVMALTGAESIRDVILFPHMRPRAASA